MPQIVDFIDAATGTSATAAQIQTALVEGNWAGLTAIDADGHAQPQGTPLSPALPLLAVGGLLLIGAPVLLVAAVGVALLAGKNERSITLRA